MKTKKVLAKNSLDDWYLTTKLGEYCEDDQHCIQCEPNGNCDACGTINGRYMEVVNEYASTCDWCGELTSHEEMVMDPLTQLGYCIQCVNNGEMPAEILKRLENKNEVNK